MRRSLAGNFSGCAELCSKAALRSIVLVMQRALTGRRKGRHPAPEGELWTTGNGTLSGKKPASATLDYSC